MRNRSNASREDIILFAVIYFGLGFVLHFLWEYVQCSPYFRHLENSPNLSSMFKATGGDLLMMSIVYGFVSLAFHSWVWFKQNITFRLIGSIAVFSVAIAVCVEIWALETNRWTYTSANPILPFIGVSVLPLLQMLLINPVAAYIAIFLISKRHADQIRTIS